MYFGSMNTNTFNGQNLLTPFFYMVKESPLQLNFELDQISQGKNFHFYLPFLSFSVEHFPENCASIFYSRFCKQVRPKSSHRITIFHVYKVLLNLFRYPSKQLSISEFFWNCAQVDILSSYINYSNNINLQKLSNFLLASVITNPTS